MFTTVVILMRAGWSLKDAASVLGIHPHRVTQSLDPTLHRVALLWQADPTRTMLAILDAVATLDSMSDAELDLLERSKMGRLDRSELHPSHVPTVSTPSPSPASRPSSVPSYPVSSRATTTIPR
jgi:hypothetical protein